MRPPSLRLPAFLCALCALCGETALAQDLTPRARPQDKPVLIMGATIHPISGPAIENGFVLFDKGVIRAVGVVGNTTASMQQDAGQRVIDAKGQHIYPGLIGARTQLGLLEFPTVRAGVDTSETGGITPEVIAATAVNPDSTLLPVTRSSGELLAAVFPSGGSIPGRVSVIRLDGWTVPDMTVKGDAGLAINWPMTRTIQAWWMNKSEEEQRKDINKSLLAITDTIAGARAYTRAKTAGQQPEADIRYDAMASLFAAEPLAPDVSAPGPDARLPVFIQAQDYDQIQQAVAVCVKHGLRCVIVGGRDAPLCADLLKRHGVAVIVDGTHKFPKRDDSPYDDAFTLPARLQAAGVRWCLASGEETAHERNLANSAGMAVAYGLEHEQGLRSITLSAAEILGIADRYGSLAAGKSATFIVTDGDVLDVLSTVTIAFLDGREVVLSDKQKALEERYREKYALPQNGTAPKGAAGAKGGSEKAG